MQAITLNYALKHFNATIAISIYCSVLTVGATVVGTLVFEGAKRAPLHSAPALPAPPSPMVHPSSCAEPPIRTTTAAVRRYAWDGAEYKNMSGKQGVLMSVAILSMVSGILLMGAQKKAGSDRYTSDAQSVLSGTSSALN